MTNKAAKNSAIIVAALTSYLGPFMVSGVNIALPDIQRAFSVNAVLLSWVVNATLLATSVLMIPAGKLSDIYGRKKMLVLGLTIFSATGLLCSFAWGVELLIVLRVFQSTGAALILTASVALITSVFPLEERGKAIGISVAANYIGLSSGPFLGGILTHYFGWRSIFIATIPVALLAIAIAVVFLKGEWADAKGEKIDIRGSVVYGISLITLMYGLTLVPDLKAIFLIIPGIAGFVIFVLLELKIKNPVFEMRLFKNNRVFSYSTIAALISYSATYATAFLLSLYLQYILGFEPQKAGLVLASQPVMQAIFSPFAGRLSDRVQPAVIASTGMACTALGLLLLVFLQPDTNLVYLICILLLLGFGFAFFSSPNTNAIMSSVEKKYYGVASGATATVRGIGMSLSMTITTVLFSIFIGKTEITSAAYPGFIKSFKTAFIIFAVLCTIGVYFSSVRGKLNRGMQGNK
ncbi:MAG: MFS transporter [Spirochaetes bacterium]|nr:MFS transporter [Spirochaetota bacterium]